MFKKIKLVYKIIKAWVLKKLRLMLLQKVVFIGRYADVMIAASKFVEERNILVQHYVIREKQTVNIVDETLSPEVQEYIRKEQLHELKKYKEVSKAKRMILFYGQDTQLHRWLGYRKTVYHMMLAA